MRWLAPRSKRRAFTDTTEANGGDVRALHGKAKPRSLTPEEADLYGRALKGDKDAVAAMRRTLKESPEIADQLAGDAADSALSLLIQVVWKNYPVTRDAMRVKLDELRAELAGEHPSALERLLVDRIVAGWLHMAHADTLYAGNVDTANQRTVEHLEERRDRAHRRYLSAIKALAQVRRLLVPMVQVNVAEQQVVANVGR